MSLFGSIDSFQPSRQRYLIISQFTVTDRAIQVNEFLCQQVDAYEAQKPMMAGKNNNNDVFDISDAHSNLV